MSRYIKKKDLKKTGIRPRAGGCRITGSDYGRCPLPEEAGVATHRIEMRRDSMPKNRGKNDTSLFAHGSSEILAALNRPPTSKTIDSQSISRYTADPVLMMKRESRAAIPASGEQSGVNRQPPSSKASIATASSASSRFLDMRCESCS